MPIIRRQEAEQEVSRLAGLRRRADDGAVVLAEDLRRGADVIGVPYGRHDAERRAAERAAGSGDQLLEGVFLRPKDPERSRFRRCGAPLAWELVEAVRCQLIGSKKAWGGGTCT